MKGVDYTRRRIHTEEITHRRDYTPKRLHTEEITQQKILHTEEATHGRDHTQKGLYGGDPIEGTKYGKDESEKDKFGRGGGLSLYSVLCRNGKGKKKTAPSPISQIIVCLQSTRLALISRAQ